MASKNARTKSKTDIHLCRCGGQIHMKSLFSKGKLTHSAECEKCNKTARRPKDLI